MITKYNCTFLALFLVSMAAPTLAADDDQTVTKEKGKKVRVLQGSARHSQSMNSAVKLFSAGSQPEAQGATATTRPSGRVQYPQVYYIPNAPVTPFHRQVHPLLKSRERAPAQTPPRPQSSPAVAAASTATNGIMTWAPGYASEIVTPRRESQAGVHGVLRTDSALAPRPLLAQFRSTPRLLTELLAPKEKRCATWEEWYKRVCKTVYDQWLIDDSGPGKTCIHVTVWSSRDLDCRVSDFSPAPDVIRDSLQESAFRASALRAVRSLDRCLVLEFPLRYPGRNVSFDLEISRAIDGRFGCQVVATRGSEYARTIGH